MKWLSIVFSVITLYLLSSSLFLTTDSIDKAQNLAVVSVFSPPNKNKEKLAIEVDWLIDHEKMAAEKKAKAAKDKNAKKPPPKKATKLYPTLTIGGADYQLLGIFKSDNVPFILIKADNKPLKKVKEGSEISPGIMLQKVSVNKITLSNAGNIIEFKLFEPTTRV